MIIADCHMHTRFSSDSQAVPEQMVQAALEKGLTAVCITDHEDVDYLIPEQFQLDPEQYVPAVQRLRESFAGQIQVRLGIELGLVPRPSVFYRDLVRLFPFDYVIGSVHVVNGMDPYFPEFFEKWSDEEGYRETFRETLEDLHKFSDFDALGHLDYVTRYGKQREKEYSYARFADEIDAILRFLIEHGKGLELNTAGLKYGLPYAHPHPDVLRRYRELGGEIVTVGSDAHRPEHVAYEFRKAEEVLAACGFRYYAEFIERRPTFRAIL